MSKLNIDNCANAVIESYNIANRLKNRLDTLSYNSQIFLDPDYTPEGSTHQVCSAVSDVLESLKTAEANLNKLKALL